MEFSKKHSGTIEEKDKRQWDPTLKVMKYKGYVTPKMAMGKEDYPEKSELYKLCEYIEQFLQDNSTIAAHCKKVKKSFTPICVYPQSVLEDTTLTNASVNFKFRFTGFDPTKFYDLSQKELKFNKNPVSENNIHMITPGSEFIAALDLSTVCLGSYGASLIRKVDVIALRIAEGKQTTITDLMAGIKIVD